MTITKAECDRLAKQITHPGWDITAYVYVQCPPLTRWQRFRRWLTR
jgi:hypothetical protein